jgi:hypothetical protein
MSADREITPDQLAVLQGALTDGIRELILAGVSFPMTLEVTDSRGARIRFLLSSPSEVVIVESTTRGALSLPFAMAFRSHTKLAIGDLALTTPSEVPSPASALN